ncbi:hypothetical protein D3C87_1169250 [compost metagenome]
MLVSGNCRDDVSPFDRFLRALADLDGKTLPGEITGAFFTGGPVDIEKAQRVDAENGLEGARLEFALRAIADDGHGAGIFAGEIFRRDG